jgi:hypothetical protein
VIPAVLLSLFVGVLAGVRKEKGILSNDRIAVDVDPVSLL